MSATAPTPPDASTKSVASLVIGTADVLFWLFITIAIVDNLWLRINYINVLAQADLNKLQDAYDLLIAGLLLRVMLILYTIVATGNKKGLAALFDVSFTIEDATIFTITLTLAIFASVVIDAVTPPAFTYLSGTAGMVILLPISLSLFVVPNIGRVAKSTWGQVFKKHRRAFLWAFGIAPLILLPIQTVHALAVQPLAATTYSVTPIPNKFFGVLVGISEETFFRGALLPLFIIILSIAIPSKWFKWTVLIAVPMEETIFAWFHSNVYGTDPANIWVVFIAGLMLSFAYLSGPLTGRPAKLSANQGAHAGIDYLAG